MESRAAHGVVLLGHGAAPRDMPRAWVRELKELSRRAGAGDEAAAEQARALDQRIRSFRRDDTTDPYRAGLLALGARLRLRLGGRPLVMAFHELCAPSLADAIAELAAGGATRITVLSTMITRGGMHAEKDIPAAIEAARARHVGIDIQFGWPLDLDRVAEMFAAHVSD